MHYYLLVMVNRGNEKSCKLIEQDNSKLAVKEAVNFIGPDWDPDEKITDKVFAEWSYMEACLYQINFYGESLNLKDKLDKNLKTAEKKREKEFKKLIEDNEIKEYKRLHKKYKNRKAL